MYEPSLLTMSGSSTPASCTFVAEKPSPPDRAPTAAEGAATIPDGTPSPPEPTIWPAWVFAYASNSPQELNGCSRPAAVADPEAAAIAAALAPSATSPTTQPIALPSMRCLTPGDAGSARRSVVWL